MKTYKKIMDVLAGIEKLILVVSTILILVLTVGGSSFRSDYLTGSSSCMPRGRACQFESGNRKTAKKNKKTNCNFSDCIICNFYSDIVLLRNG